MKIFLANPPWVDSHQPDLWGVRAGSRWPHWQKRQADGALPRYLPFPFFLAIAAAQLKQAGHEVLLVDGVTESLSRENFLQRIADFKPNMLFFETSTPSFDYDLDLMKSAGTQNPHAFIVAGGAHCFSLSAKNIADAGVPHAWVVGEYELVLPRIADHLETDKNFPIPPELAGVFNVAGGAGRAKIPDVNALALPLFEQLPMRRYSDPVCGLPTPNAHSWLSRGCPYRCSFCVWPQVIYGDHRYRRRSIDLALDEVERLINEYDCESFYFDDDTANIGEERMIELADKIKARGLSIYPWAMMARADCMTPKALENLADAGLYAIKYGVESVSPLLINACGKATRLDLFTAAINKTRELGIKQHLTFTFGLPGETVATMLETAAFAEEIAPESTQFSICTPFPGTRFHHECVKHGWLISDDWKRFTGSDEAVVSTPQLPAKTLVANFKKIVERWENFIVERTARRRKRLLESVSEAVKKGLRWHFRGDEDFAKDILNNRKLTTMRTKKIEDADIVIIVSRHDEEKIYRRMLRSGELSNHKIYRLYQDYV